MSNIHSGNTEEQIKRVSLSVILFAKIKLIIITEIQH